MAKIEHHIRLKISQSKDPTIQERIAAQHRLWDFIHDIKENIANWPDTEMDLCEQIITSSFQILMPHYSGIEIEKVIRTIYFSMKKLPPSEFTKRYVELYCSYVSARLKHYK